MDEATHKRWCPLHLRAAMGETLNAEEQAFYEAQMRQLHVEEEQTLSGSKENLLRTRQKNEEMKAAYIRLSRQIEEMLRLTHTRRFI